MPQEHISDRFSGDKNVTITIRSPEETKALHERRLAEAWPDNAEFAADVNRQIADAVQQRVPQVKALAIAEHEAFGITKCIEAINALPLSLEAYRAFETCSAKYDLWQCNRDRRGYSKYRSVEHPSVSIPAGIKELLHERGFWWNAMGWFDPRGASIKAIDWVELVVDVAKKGQNAAFHLVDPAGVLDVERQFDAHFNALKEAAAAATRIYASAYRAGKAAASTGGVSPHADGSIEDFGWNRGFRVGIEALNAERDGLGDDIPY